MNGRRLGALTFLTVPALTGCSDGDSGGQSNGASFAVGNDRGGWSLAQALDEVPQAALSDAFVLTDGDVTGALKAGDIERGTGTSREDVMEWLIPAVGAQGDQLTSAHLPLNDLPLAGPFDPELPYRQWGTLG